MSSLPWTPDFEDYAITSSIRKVSNLGDAVELTWDDAKRCQYDVFALRENSPDSQTIHPQSRELLISPLVIPADLTATNAHVRSDGALTIEWSTGDQSHYHPGWLRHHAWFEGEQHSTQLNTASLTSHWDAKTLTEVPSYDGNQALEHPTTMLAWLEAVAEFGIARLQHLPNQDGLLEKIVRQIGPPRESNFGAMYVLDVKDQPDSNAFTSCELIQHMDMPTREHPHGLQFLFCRANTAVGGEGVYVDGLKIANDIKTEEPATYQALTEIEWVFNNRSQEYDYRAKGPVIQLDQFGQAAEIRLTSWLRAPLQAPVAVQRQAYQSIRSFTEYTQNPKYQLVFAYQAGDLIAFDNRRILHGRKAYNSAKGRRFIEGIYADRDELYSRIRVLRKQIKSAL